LTLERQRRVEIENEQANLGERRRRARTTARRAAVVAHQGPGGKPVNSGAVPPILAAWDRKLRALPGAS